MVQWHEKRVAKIGIRAVGLVLLVSAGTESAWLQHMVATAPFADASPAQALLAALMFASASAGLLLACVGTGLWKPVAVSDRWATRVPVAVARDPETWLCSMTTTQGGKANQESRDAPYDGEQSPVRHSHLSPARRG